MTGLGIYPDGMVEHDGHVGQLLDKLDELGIADNTIVMYSTDNGAEVFSWPDGGTTPFRGEKNDNWEGGFRVPLLVKWPGVLEPGSRSSAIIAHEDWIPNVPGRGRRARRQGEAAGRHDRGGQVLQGVPRRLQHAAVLQGEVEESPRKEFFYFSDTGDLLNLRYNQWEDRLRRAARRGLRRVAGALRLPPDPEALQHPERSVRARGSRGPGLRRLESPAPLRARARAGLRRAVLSTFQEFPPRQKPASFSIDQVLEKLQPPTP